MPSISPEARVKNAVTIVERITSLIIHERKVLSISMSEFSVLVGIKYNRYRDIELGIRNMNLLEMFHICDALKLDPSRLISQAKKGRKNSVGGAHRETDRSPGFKLKSSGFSFRTYCKPREEFCTWVKQARKAKGLTQTDLAKLANIGQATISLIERNEYQGPIDEYAKGMLIAALK